MRIKSIVSYCLFIMLFFVGINLAQDMKPDAAKLYNAGNEMLKAGNYKGAVENYDKALDIEKDFRTYYQKGVALKKSGNLDGAKEAFENSLKQKDDFEATYNALGGVYFSMGNLDKAIENFQKVLDISKNNSIKTKVKSNIALAYAKKGNEALSDGNTEKAIDNLKKAVSFSNYDAAYLSLAKVYSETGKNDEAIDAAQNALKYRSSISKGGPYYYMGMAYKAKGDTEKAKEMFSQAKSDATYKKLVEYELSAMK